MLKKIFQSLLRRFFLTEGRAPISPKEWSKLRKQAQDIAKEGEKTAPFDTFKPKVVPKGGIEELLQGPVVSGGPKGKRVWDFSKKQKKGEVVDLFATEKEFSDDLYSIGQNFIKNNPRFNLELAITFRNPGTKTYGWTPTGDKSKLHSPAQRQKILDNLKKVMKHDTYQAQHAEELGFVDLTDDIFTIEKASGGRIGRYEGGIAPLVGEPSYAADFYDDRTPMEGGGESSPRFKHPDKRQGILGSGVTWTELMEGLHPFMWSPRTIEGIKRDVIDPVFKKKLKWNELDDYYRQLEMDKDMRDPEDVPSKGEQYAAQGGRIGLAGGGALFKFIEALFIKASNDIRQGKGIWKKLNTQQKIVQHDNLTKKVTEFQKTGKLPEGMEEYFGIDVLQAFEGASKKATRLGKRGPHWKKQEVKAQKYADEMEAEAWDKGRDTVDSLTGGKKIDKNRKLTDEEWKDFVEDNSGDLNEELLTGDETLNDLENMVAQERAYADDMYRQYKSGALDKYVKPEELEKQRLFRQKKIDNVLAKAYDEVFYQKPVSGDYKYDADVLSDSIAEQLGKGSFTDLPQTHQTQIYNTALKRVTQDMQMKQTLKNVEEKMILSDFDVKGRKGNAEGGIMREGHIFGGSAGLKAMWKKMMQGISKRRGGEPITKLFPKLSTDERRMEKLVMGTPEQKAFREGEEAHKLEGIDLLINRMKHDKKIIERQAKNKAMKDEGLDFLMKDLEKSMSDVYGPHLKKYTDIDKDILQMENIKKNLIMKDRKLNAYGGRIGYAGGGKTGLPAVTMGTPQMNMQQPQMPAGPQPAGIPGGTIVAQNQMHQSPWMGSQMPQPGGMPQRGMPRPMAAEGGRIGFGLGGFNKARRAFLKMMAGITGAGIAGGTGLLKFGKAAKVVPKVTETITRGADGMPIYVNNLIEVVKAKGVRDIIEGVKRTDYSTVHSYKGVDVIEDGAGNIKIKSEKGGVSTDPYTGKSYEGVSQENHMQIDKGEWIKPTKSKKGIKTHDEYIEGSVRPDMDGKMKDFEDGLDEAIHLDFKKIADEVDTLIIKKTKKASGGLAYALGE